MAGSRQLQVSIKKSIVVVVVVVVVVVGVVGVGVAAEVNAIVWLPAQRTCRRQPARC